MPTVENIAFTIEQTAEHHALKIVRLGYAYTLDRTKDVAGDSDEFELSIDILGHDRLIDDKLALGVDRHEITCRAGAAESLERSLLVGQALLDEDVGTDEIKLRINAKDSEGNKVTAMTPVIRGNF